MFKLFPKEASLPGGREGEEGVSGDDKQKKPAHANDQQQLHIMMRTCGKVKVNTCPPSVTPECF